MARSVAAAFATGALVAATLASGPAIAQKQAGILKVYHWDSPPSMSIHEEVTISTDMPMMGVFNIMRNSIYNGRRMEDVRVDK